MPKYDRCPPEVAKLANAVIKRFDRHDAIRETGFRIQYFFAIADEDDFGAKTGNAITVHGMPAAARAKKLGPLDRIKTECEGEILIDQEKWEAANDNQRMALLDHELYHFEVDPLERADDGRPKVWLRKHDHQFGWFNCVAQTWGKDSYEVTQARTIMEKSGQLYWPDFEHTIVAQRELAKAPGPVTSITVSSETDFRHKSGE